MTEAPGRLSRVLIWVVFSLICLVCLISLGAVKRTIEVTGPFKAEPDAAISKALFVDLRLPVALRSLASSGGDNPTNPRQSELRVFVNGTELTPPHSLHETIRNIGGGSFSHWHDYLIFSLPEGIENAHTTRLKVTYPIRLNPGLAYIAIPIALAFGVFLVLGFYKQAPSHFGRFYATLQSLFLEVSISSVRAVYYFVYAILAIFVLLALFFLGTTVVAWFHSYALPNTAFFHWWPNLGFLAMQEPFWGHALFAIVLVGFLAAWLVQALGSIPADLVAIERQLELGFRRFGLVFLLGLYFFSVGATWAGIPRLQDYSANAIAGLVPFSDANGHFQYVYFQAANGDWQPFAARRPLATAFRTVGAVVADYNNFHFLMLQVFALAIATYFAVRAMIAWRGIWAGLGFLGFVFILLRPYLPTNLTEPHGIFWALISVPFLIRALRFNTIGDNAAVFHLTVWALMTRMGAMFTIPAIAAWSVATRWRQPKRYLVNVATLILLIGVLNLTLVAGLSRLYTAPGGAIGSNFASVFCGLTHGSDWTGCSQIYAKELASNQGEAEQATLFYSKAFSMLEDHPEIFISRLYEGASYFLSFLWTHMLSGQTGSVPDAFPFLLWWATVAAGLIWTLARKRERTEGSFWLLFVLSLLASAPFVIFDDGWRVLCASFVLLSVLFSSAFTSPIRQALPDDNASERQKVKLVRYGLLVLIATLCVITPKFAYELDLLKRRTLPVLDLSPSEEIYLGSSRMSGFLVIPDGELLPITTPAIYMSQFTQIIHNSGVERYQKLITPAPLIDPPFAFVSAIPLTTRAPAGLLLLAPPEVLSTLDDKPWRMRLQRNDGEYWVRVLDASKLD